MTREHAQSFPEGPESWKKMAKGIDILFGWVYSMAGKRFIK